MTNFLEERPISNALWEKACFNFPLMIELTLPELDVKEKNTKDLIISILLRDHPLTVKQIWCKIRKIFGKTISYHGVYKTVIELHESKVLEKNEAGYEISLDWVKKVKNFSENLETNYPEKRLTSVLKLSKINFLIS